MPSRQPLQKKKKSDTTDNSKKHKININKLITLNGDISHLKIKGKYDLSFIDGIHTDKNVFSDFGLMPEISG